MERLLSLLNMQRDEARPVALLFLHAFLLGAAGNLVQTTAFALFLAAFGAHRLPWVYVANAFATPLASFLLIRLGRRLSFPRLLLANLGFLLALTIALRVGLWWSGARWIVFALPVLYQFLTVLGGLDLWPLANALLDVRQGKRLFGLIGAGPWLAVVVTGVLIPSLVLRVGSANLLLLAAASLAASAGLVAHIARAFRSQLAAVGGATALQQRQSGGDLMRSRYVLSIFGLMVLSWVAYFVVDNIFYYRAEEHYVGEAQLASFLGTYLALAGVFALLSNALVVGPVISRYGVHVGLLVLPATHTVLTSAMIVSASVAAPQATLLTLAILAKLLDVSLGFSLDKSATAILYQPLPGSQRHQAQTIAEGVFQPLANGAAGVVLLALGTLFAGGVTPLVYGLFCVAVGWCALAACTGRGYLVQLMRALERRQLQPVELATGDGATRIILRRALASLHPGAVIYALNLIEATEPRALPAALQQLLQHDAPAVRQDALDRLARLGLSSALPGVRARLQEETVPTVRASAVRALGVLAEGNVLAELSPYLEDASLDVRQGALVGMLRSGEGQTARLAEQQVLAAAASVEPDERALAAGVLGEAGIPGYNGILLALLGDRRPQVLRAALRASGRAGGPELWPSMIAALGLPGVRQAAFGALAANSTPVLDVLQAAFCQVGQSPDVRVQLVRLHGRIGGRAAVAWLCEVREHADGSIRTEALRALQRCGYRAVGAEAASIEEQIAREAALSAQAGAILDDLGHDPALQLLRAALERTIEEDLERVFLLLSLLYDREAMARAYRSLTHASPDRAAYALEVVDVLVRRELKPTVFGLVAEVEARRTAEGLHSARSHATEDDSRGLREVVAAPPGRFSAWTRSCALYAIGQVSASSLGEAVAGALSTSSPLVRETAVWALARLDREGDGMPPTAVQRDPTPSVACVAQDAGQGGSQEDAMLTTIEKVLALKSASIFAETPDETLAAVAALLKEIRLQAGETVFEKGDPGDCMYIIVHGTVRVHDDAHVLGRRSDGDVFGEMALLDPEPRMASVTAAEDTLLLRLEQDALYELMDERSDVARGMIRVLCRRLREQGAPLQPDAGLDTRSGSR